MQIHKHGQRKEVFRISYSFDAVEIHVRVLFSGLESYLITEQWESAAHIRIFSCLRLFILFSQINTDKSAIFVRLSD